MDRMGWVKFVGELGWNHVGHPRAPRAWGFLCLMAVSDAWKEVIEVTDDEPGTTRASTLVHHSITLEMQGGVPRAWNTWDVNE
jgi:hypothetical protein